MIFNLLPRHIHAKQRVFLLRTAVIGISLACAAVATWAQTSPGASKISPTSPSAVSATPDVRIETFASERGFVVGMDNVILLCVARNVGPTALPENALRLRCYPISGLDYTSGNLLPLLPALAPGQAVAYRWRLAPTEAHNALVAGVVLESAGDRKKDKGESATSAGADKVPVSPSPENSANAVVAFPSSLAFAVIPHLPRLPALGDVPVFKDPLAHVGESDGGGMLLNNHVGARVQIGERREPLLLLAAKEGAIWRTVANSLPLLRVCVGEDGQLPWWQSFRCQQIRAREDKDSAALTLTGSIGAACRVELTFEARPDTGALIGHVRLTALRALRLSGAQLPALAGSIDDKTLIPPRSDGSPLMLADAPSLLPDDARLAAAHSGATTFGVTWPADPPLPGWKWGRLPLADGVVTQNLGVQALGDPRGDLVPTGASVEFTFRLFAFAPSDTVRDALRFQMP
jgi:hypothetical protein